MRSLGEFFGHIAQAVRTDPATLAPPTTPSPAEPALPAPKPVQLTRQTVEEKQVDTPSGPMKLRRTVIDEVELPGDGPSA